MLDRIYELGTYFAGHEEISAPAFAGAVLAQQRRLVRRSITAGRLIPQDAADRVLQAKVGKPDHPRGLAVLAYVNDGAWKAKCPDCGGAELVDFANPVFMCCSCWNASIGGDWRRVVVPTSATRAGVERLLLRRVRPNRNFRPDRGETLLQLARENRDHGLEWRVKEDS